jgi:hypothetical protein
VGRRKSSHCPRPEGHPIEIAACLTSFSAEQSEACARRHRGRRGARRITTASGTAIATATASTAEPRGLRIDAPGGAHP